jgi:hypothetical protein
MAYNNTPKTNIVIDIETIVHPVSQKDIDKAMEEYAPPANYKTPEAIERHRLKFRENIVEKLIDDKRFSIGGKKMICAALGVADEETGDVTEIESWASDDLSVVTVGLVNYLDRFRDYRLVGWNHVGFDLPEICKSFSLTKVRPRYKPTKWDLLDLSAHPFKKTKLKDAAKAFGLEILDVDGAAVSRLHEEGRWEDIKTYNEHDVRLTGRLFLAAQSIYSFY